MTRKLRRKKWAFLRWYYTARYGRPVGRMGGMLPKLGKGRFVDVEQRGPFLEMTDHDTGDVVRLVPYQPNHGVMVEMWRQGRCEWRTHCGVDAFARMGFDGAESVASGNKQGAEEAA